MATGSRSTHPRVAVASVVAETNTFAPHCCGWHDFTVAFGDDAAARTRGTNSEMGGAVAAIEAAGGEAVPLVHAWAMPNGPVDADTFARLRGALVDRLSAALPCDGLVLSLHGAMVATDETDADAALLDAARHAAGPDVPVVVCLDLHANVTARLVASADAVVGYHTDPHVDMGATGERAVGLLLARLEGRLDPTSALAKRPMIVPAESMDTTTGPLADIRALIDGERDPAVLDVSLFPVQPWLDVPELGLGVVVTTDGDVAAAARLADRYADLVWERRHVFRVDRLLPPPEAIAAARASSVRPFVIAHSADAPTAGAAGDSAVMVTALLEHGPDLAAVVQVVDPAAVAECHVAGVGAELDLAVGGGIDPRWSLPAPVRGRVVTVGGGSYRLEGASFTGLEISMGRFAVVAVGELLLLLSERSAWTADPATFRFAGIEPEDLDVVVVRSCSDFRPNFPDAAVEAVTLDVAGVATPRLERLKFERVDRPLWPLDASAKPASG